MEYLLAIMSAVLILLGVSVKTSSHRLTALESKLVTRTQLKSMIKKEIGDRRK